MAGVFTNDKCVVDMDEDRKIKVAMVCHFSTKEIRGKLHLNKLGCVNFVRRIMRKQILYYSDFASWIDSITSYFPECKTVDLHVIAPHPGMRKSTEAFAFKGVSYHFLSDKPSSALVRMIDRKMFNYKLINYKANKRRIVHIIETIKPDIVVLVGAENAFYSSALVDLKGYPIYILCQTVYNNPEFEASYPEALYKKRADIERRLLLGTKYVGVYSEKHSSLLRKIGYEGFIFDFKWPNDTRKRIVSSQRTKQYDFINFAMRMSAEKGYHDSLHALAIVKKQYPNVKMALIDNGNKVVKQELIDIIKKESIEDNVSFIHYFEQKEELFDFLSSVRFAVLPCKVDYISGTQLQALDNGLPIVVYKTEGTPTLNAEMECALIADIDDIENLAEHMIHLLKDPDLADKLSKNGKVFMQRFYEKKQNSFNRLLLDFKAIVEHYNNNVTIPESLLMD